MLGKRIATGLALAAGAILLVVWGPDWMVTAVVAALNVIGLAEYTSMALPDDSEGDRAATILLGVGVSLSMMPGSTWVGAGIALALVASAFHTLFRFRRIEDALRTLAIRAFGLIYVPYFLSHYLVLRPQPYGWQLILTTLVASYASDTGAYFTGRYLGKTKLYPAISPAKTVEGSIGGIAGSILGVLIARAIYFDALSIGSAVAFGFVFAVVAQLGDLLESQMKRACGVKDSGTLLPGHGGLLDRLDSIYVSAPVVAAIGPYFVG